MSQHDFSIANQGFPSFRADLNSGLEALATNSSGATAPTTTYAYQFWYDTANDLLKMRNGDNDAWITLAAFDQANDEWQIRSAIIQAVDAAGVEIKTDDGTTRLDIADDGTVTVPGDLTVTGTLTATLDSNIIQEGNSSVEVVDAGFGRIEFTVDGAERMRIDEDGNINIADSTIYTGGIGGANTFFQVNGTTGSGTVLLGRGINPDNEAIGEIRFYNSENSDNASSGINSTFVAGITARTRTSDSNAGDDSGADIVFITKPDSGSISESMRLDGNGTLKFDSGYGSAATAYGCRAWVNFDGTGTVSIRESGNVSSITDYAVGAYGINFSASLPDRDYCSPGTAGNVRLVQIDRDGPNFKTTTQLRIAITEASAVKKDADYIDVAIFR